MERRVRILSALAVALAAQGASLDDVLARMDAVAKQFKSYSASAKVTNYRKVIDEATVQTGSFRLRKIKNGVGGIMDLTEGTDRTVLHFNGPIVERYFPKAGEIQVFDAHQYRAVLNQMLLLGFSMGRDEIRKDYDVKLGGAEKLGGLAAARIVLTPKSAEALKVATSIELWVPDSSGNAIRQKGNQPSGDYKLVEYSNLQLNPSLPDSAFELNAPEGTKTVKGN